jgi:type I restriction enzyme S subunit
MTRPNLNAVAIVPTELSHAIASTGFDVLRSSHIQPKWLFYLVQTDVFVSAMSMLVQGALYPAVRPRDIRAYLVALPPRAEQDRIIAEIEALLTDLEAAVASLKRVQANLKRYRASVLNAACEGRLVPTESELARKEGRTYETGEQLLARILKERRAKWEADQLAKMLDAGKAPKDDSWKRKYKEPSSPNTSSSFELPEGWTCASSDQLLAWVTSGSRGWARYYSSDGALFLRMTNLDHGTITLDLSDIQRVKPPKGTEGERTRVAAGDILISITADVGMVAVIPEGFPDALINQHVALCRLVSCFSAKYMAWFLASDSGQQQLRHLQRGATKQGLGLDDIRAVTVPTPPRSEQGRIVSEVEQVVSICDRIEAQVDTLFIRVNRLRQAILKSAFEGKLVPQDPSDEPASVLLEHILSERSSEQAHRGKQPRGLRTMIKEHMSVRRSILEVLKAAPGPMTPEELFVKAGHAPATIDDFYAELKNAIDSHQIDEMRTKNDARELRVKKAGESRN